MSTIYSPADIQMLVTFGPGMTECVWSDCYYSWSDSLPKIQRYNLTDCGRHVM
jgi:hypothetical protein